MEKIGLIQKEIETLPFVQLPLLVMSDRRLSAGAKLAYCVLLRFSFQKTICFPSMGRIADMIGVSVDTARRHLKELVDRGLFVVESRVGQSNVYSREGRMEDVYCEDGFLSDDSLDTLLSCGEFKLVERLKEERSEIISLMKFKNVSNIPDEINISEKMEVVDVKKNKPRKIIRNFEELKGMAEASEKNTRNKIDGRAKRLQQKKSNPEWVEVTQEAKNNNRNENMKSKAEKGSLLNTLDVEAVWKSSISKKWPEKNLYRPWSIKDKGRIKVLASKWTYEDLIKAIPVIFNDWENLALKYGLRGYPSVGAVVGYADSLLPDALFGELDMSVRSRAMAEGEYDPTSGQGGGLHRPFDGM